MNVRLVLAVSSASLLACTGLFGETDTGAGGGDCANTVFFRDQDGDGFGAKGSTETGCEAPNGYADNSDDCDDQDPDVFPGAVEVCDSVDADEDCDGDADEDDDNVVLTVFYRDSDGDGFGDATGTKEACDLPDDYVENAEDCDDDASSAYPGGKEVCDSRNVDEDCDGLVNDDDDSMSSSGLGKYYPDDDGDGYGDGTAITACDPGNGYAEDDGDCDDTEPKANPGESEECNDGIDNNCNGSDDGCGFSGTVAASTADAIIRGAAYDGLGYQTRPAGDQNGDGIDDLLLAATGAGTRGEAYIFYGPLSGTQSSSAADVTISSTASNEAIGYGMAGGFDWNNDGDPDIAVGDPYMTSLDSGAVYVFYGPVTSDLSVTAADRTLTGGTYDYIGFDLQGCDWDGDGKDDLVTKDNNDNTVFIDRGSLGSGSAAASSSADVSINPGTSYTDAAFGDADGDGADDMLVGGGWASSYAGKTYYVEGGSTSGTIAASTGATATFTGQSADDQAGDALALCDLDGDGNADAVIGAPYAAGGGAESGVAYVFTYGFSGTASVTTADATLNGTAASDLFAYNLACLGDVTTDGNDDLGVTAYDADSGGTGSGTGYIFFGNLSGSVAAASADAIIKGDAAADNLYDVFGVGDVTDDGAPDAAFGARANDDGGSDAGASWIFAGGGI